MVNWDFVIEEDALASVLPVEYRRFARPIRDGLNAFLQGLPAQAQASILPVSREFVTGLSTLDVARAVLSGPATVARFWVGQSLDLLNACSTPKMEGPQDLNVTARRTGMPIPQPTSRGTSAGQTGVMHDVADR